MANDILNIRAALQMISQASTESLIQNIQELSEANAAIAKAILSLSRSFCEEIGQLETPAKNLTTSENTDFASSQAQPPTILGNNRWKEVSQYKSRRSRPENVIVRLAQYCIQRRLAGTSVPNSADEHGVLDDLRKVVITSTPVLLALVRSLKKRRSSTNSRR